jgi:tRNA-splicing ligase RtcB
MITVEDKLYSWATSFDAGTIQQAARTSRLPIVHDHIALMPDAHVGIGATVGSVIPTKNAIIPAAVGVDIGCGMIAVETDFTSKAIPDSLDPLLPRIANAIPAGVGQGHERQTRAAQNWFDSCPIPENSPLNDHKNIDKAMQQFGSLGSGNHFFEICLDRRDIVWVVLHSGSRGIGNKMATWHINEAKKLEFPHVLEDKDLAYFEQGTPEFNRYIDDMNWAQAYALANREQMMNAAFLEVLGYFTDGEKSGHEMKRINCHHNFTVKETHGGVDLWITRKGAIRAGRDDYGVIPGSMGTETFIVHGRGNPDSWNSCAHGAGRRMSRSRAKKELSLESLKESMEGRVWLEGKAQALLDEHPDSYKNIHTVMDDQKDLVEVDHVLHQILNYKGTK